MWFSKKYLMCTTIFSKFNIFYSLLSVWHSGGLSIVCPLGYEAAFFSDSLMSSFVAIFS